MPGGAAFELNRRISADATAARGAVPSAGERVGKRGAQGRLRPSRVPVPSSVPTGPARDLLPGPAQPLAVPLKEEMEGRLGADFSDVRMHSGAAARASAARLGADAYTLGSHVVVGDGGADKHTLAHELTHVIQQRTGPVAGTEFGGGLRIGDPSSSFERAADSAADRALSRSAPPRQADPLAMTDPAPQGASSWTVQRAGRRGDLQGDPPVVKLIIAGSGYGKWETHVEKKIKWTRQDDTKKVDEPTYHRRDKGGGTAPVAKVSQVSFAGPGGEDTKGSSKLGGVRDIGSNSIENLVNFVPKVVQQMVTEVRQALNVDPVILIKAHSRGAVAASRVASQLREANPKTRIELVLFDPVPGPDHKNEDLKINLSNLDEFTLIYSVASGYGVGFDPQTVFGAKRIIISRQGHSAGLSAGFNYNGVVCKGSRLNSIPPGVYVDFNQDGESNIPLKRVDSIEDAMGKFEIAFKESIALKGDVGRKSIVEQVLKEYFIKAASRKS